MNRLTAVPVQTLHEKLPTPIFVTQKPLEYYRANIPNERTLKLPLLCQCQIKPQLVVARRVVFNRRFDSYGLSQTITKLDYDVSNISMREVNYCNIQLCCE